MSVQKKKSTEIDRFLNPEEFYRQFKEIKSDEFPKFGENTEVEFKNFNFRYGANPYTLYGVTMQIPKNSITAIIGPSGCGKSTLLRSINRMNEEIAEVYHEGELFVDGEDIYSPIYDKRLLRIKVGMVFQKPQPFPRSIYDNVAFGPRLHGVKSKEQLDEIVHSSLQDVGLLDEVGNRLDDHAYALSGGQQQRLCIARSIAVNPSVLLCDEPASALDPRSTYQIEELLMKLKKNYTVIIVTHNMQQAARISDYSMFMYAGNVVEFDKTSKIFENPHYDLTENYISGRFG